MFRQWLENNGGNRVVIALSFARLGDAIGNSVLFIVIPLIVTKLPSPAFPFPESVRVGFLIAWYGIVNTLLQPVMGAWSDRLGLRKPLIQIGLVIMGIGTLAFLAAGRFIDLLLLRSLQGVGVAITVPAALAMIASSSVKETRGGSMGIYTTMRMLGLIIGPLIGGFLVDNFTLSINFVAAAGFIFVAIFLVQIWVRETPPDRSRTKGQRFQIIDRKLINPGILGASCATLIMASAFTMMVALETQFDARLNMSVLGFSIAYSAYTVSRFFFQVPLGRLSDRLGRKPLIIAGFFLMAPATAWLGFATSSSQLIGARLVQGLASAGIAAPAFAVVADLATSGSEGRQMSLMSMGFGLGIAVGPLMAGVLAVISFQLPFIVGGLLSLLGAWVVYHFVPETVSREPRTG